MYSPSLFHQILPIFFFIIIILFQYHSTFATRTLKNNDDHNPESHNIDFIRESCNITLYPDLCYSTFSHFSSQITETDPKRQLACLALSTTVSEAVQALAIAKRIVAKGKAYARKDCIYVLSDSHEQLKMSVQEMDRADPDGFDFRFRVSNVQTWVSAALTDEDTCTDGIKEGDYKRSNNKSEDYRKVREEVVKFSHLTSITLAFINNYADSC